MKDADVIIIGTGIGGATLGRALAERGHSVLFLEKGQKRHANEVNALNYEMFEPTGRLARGLWPAPICGTIDGAKTQVFGPLGAGIGGSSAFYAATLERPERYEIDAGAWPLNYEDLVPHFAKATKQYEICGEVDPLTDEPDLGLSPPPAFSEVDQSFLKSLNANGLHPYHAHTAIRYDEGGKEIMRLDGRTAGIEPALETGHARLVDRCTVKCIHQGDAGLRRVEAVRHGVSVSYVAPIVVIAAGAYNSPRLAMTSKLPDPSGMIGRNLMFHLNEMVAVWPKGDADKKPSKAISFRDLYRKDGHQFGTVQAMGVDISYGEIVHYLTLALARTPLAKLPGKGLAVRAVSALASRLFGRAKVFVGLLEDRPYPENRILPTEGDSIEFVYTIHNELRDRRHGFRRELARAFRGHRKWFLSMSPELNLGHPCGTMQMGTVTDAHGRLKGSQGLWICDASLFPTSLGVNPSLTIAALALHVGEAIHEELERCANQS